MVSLLVHSVCLSLELIQHNNNDSNGNGNIGWARSECMAKVNNDTMKWLDL